MMGKIRIPCKRPVLRNGKNTTQIRRLGNYFLRLLPEKGTPEYDQLCEEIQGLTTTNCWYVEYALAKFLIGTFTDYEKLEVKL